LDKAGVGRADSAGGPKTGRRPVKVRTAFSFFKKKSKFSKTVLIPFLKKQRTFSKFDPKTKVVKNLILYNFA
jgi:hypothetical protein